MFSLVGVASRSPVIGRSLLHVSLRARTVRSLHLLTSSVGAGDDNNGTICHHPSTGSASISCPIGVLRLWRRQSSSTTATSNEPVKVKKARKKKKRKKQDKVSPTDVAARTLYRRDEDRIRFPQAVLGISSFSTIYWVWYCVDFVPAVNSSPHNVLHASYSIGLVGLGISFIVLAGAAMYPMNLISRIDLDESTKETMIYTHRLPFLRGSDPIRYPISDIVLDQNVSETEVIKKRGTFTDFSSHIMIRNRGAGGSRLPYLLSIGPSTELVNDKLMMQAFVDTNLSKKNNSTKSKGGTGSRKSKKKKRAKL